MKHKYYRI